jgi:UDP-N-acetylmuramate dehydrogenase
MKLFENYSLRELNTFHIDVKAKRFIEVDSVDEINSLTDLQKITSEKFLILGGGSNILFTKDFDGTIIHLNLKSFSISDEDNNSVFIKAEAGMIWDDLVKFSVDKNLGGIENLAMIPGTVGAAPIQNIGAYGQELKDSLYEVEYYDLIEKRIITLNKENCMFGYRDSIFKKSLKNRFIILTITLRLSKNPEPVLNYGNVGNELSKAGILKPNIKDVSNIIRKIRSEKLPDPAKIGNAGSFFKNPFVDDMTFQKIKADYPDVPSFKQENKIKIPAAWLIEKSGLKGFRKGNAGTYPNQPLVIVNYGEATGEEILELAKLIQKTVKEKFDIGLEPEVNII